MLKYYLTKEFGDTYNYDGNDLGSTWSKDMTSFKVWSPMASCVNLIIFNSSIDNYDDIKEIIKMEKKDKGVWHIDIKGDLDKTYYAYEVCIDNKKSICQDPYSYACGVNGLKSMVIALNRTNPNGWLDDKRCKIKDITDAIIYELHIRDFTIHKDSGIKNKGKYIAFLESNTHTKDNIITGIDYLKELGITHVHLLPTYDFASVDEKKDTDYNWGYDPLNYNCLEGSYSTDAYKGEVRIKEYKQMVKAFHDANIGVIMDLVYNHTYDKDFCFNKLVPQYFYRNNSNGTGCGNDVASERHMVRKYIVDSCVYLAKEYHIDAFRFDLMGILDVDTMNMIRKELDTIDPNIFIYGEGWKLDTKTDKNIALAIQTNSDKTKRIAYFNDTIRDGLRGNMFVDGDMGYVAGNLDKVNDIKDCFLAKTAWSNDPTQIVNYISCHDDMTIWDRLNVTCPNVDEKDLIKYNKLAIAIVLLSQGIPFIMSGEELLKTKKDANNNIVENSYKSPDLVNKLDYSRLNKYQDVYEYYKGLIKFRKSKKVLRMTSRKQIDKAINLRTSTKKGLLVYDIVSKEEKMIVVFNPSKNTYNLSLENGKWAVYINDKKASTSPLEYVKDNIKIMPVSCLVLIQ